MTTSDAWQLWRDVWAKSACTEPNFCLAVVGNWRNSLQDLSLVLIATWYAVKAYRDYMYPVGKVLPAKGP